MLLVDAISSLAGEHLDLTRWGIDVLVGSANKCLRGVPGVAFVVAHRNFLDKACQKRHANYLDLATHLEAQKAGETPFTPPVQCIYALDAALDETLGEGVALRIEHYARLCETLKQGLTRLGIRLLLPSDAYGHTLLSCYLPEGFSFKELHASLKERGYVIYGAQGPFKHRLFRLGLVGHFGQDAIEGFLDAFEQVLERGCVR